MLFTLPAWSFRVRATVDSIVLTLSIASNYDDACVNSGRRLLVMAGEM